MEGEILFPEVEGERSPPPPPPLPDTYLLRLEYLSLLPVVGGGGGSSQEPGRKRSLIPQEEDHLSKRSGDHFSTGVYKISPQADKKSLTKRSVECLSHLRKELKVISGGGLDPWSGIGVGGLSLSSPSGSGGVGGPLPGYGYS
jgi:hypothetical protein